MDTEPSFFCRPLFVLGVDVDVDDDDDDDDDDVDDDDDDVVDDDDDVDVYMCILILQRDSFLKTSISFCICIFCVEQ